jgi:PPOX class probable F420-dependent enzyme
MTEPGLVQHRQPSRRARIDRVLSGCRLTHGFFVVWIDKEKAVNIMKLNDIARQLIGSGPATLVTINRDGSPQVSAVWVTVQRTADGGDELVTAHLLEHQKIRNIRRDPRVAVTIVSTDRSGPQTPYLSIKGTARRGGRCSRTARRDRHDYLRPGHRIPAARRSLRIPDSHHDRKGRRRGPLGDLNITGGHGRRPTDPRSLRCSSERDVT